MTEIRDDELPQEEALGEGEALRNAGVGVPESVALRVSLEDAEAHEVMEDEREARGEEVGAGERDTEAEACGETLIVAEEETDGVRRALPLTLGLQEAVGQGFGIVLPLGLVVAEPRAALCVRSAVELYAPAVGVTAIEGLGGGLCVAPTPSGDIEKNNDTEACSELLLLTLPLMDAPPLLSVAAGERLPRRDGEEEAHMVTEGDRKGDCVAEGLEEREGVTETRADPLDEVQGMEEGEGLPLAVALGLQLCEARCDREAKPVPLMRAVAEAGPLEALPVDEGVAASAPLPLAGAEGEAEKDCAPPVGVPAPPAPPAENVADKDKDGVSGALCEGELEIEGENKPVREDWGVADEKERVGIKVGVPLLEISAIVRVAAPEAERSNDENEGRGDPEVEADNSGERDADPLPDGEPPPTPAPPDEDAQAVGEAAGLDEPLLEVDPLADTQAVIVRGADRVGLRGADAEGHAVGGEESVRLTLALREAEAVREGEGEELCEAVGDTVPLGEVEAEGQAEDVAHPD